MREWVSPVKVHSRQSFHARCLLSEPEQLVIVLESQFSTALNQSYDVHLMSK